MRRGMKGITDAPSIRSVRVNNVVEHMPSTS